ncbi:MAG TPA: DUF3455 domain-containing protein [Burkholderiaceae bacterium]|nr:DUF3455 domain-containing protein [Burkholderiaceae bacterium]
MPRQGSDVDVGALHPAAIAILAAALAACTTTPPIDVPPPLQPPGAQALRLTLYARGSQVYRCDADPADATRGRWTFLAPDAVLYTDPQFTRPVGHHDAGPTWHGTDGSEVKGKVRASAPSTTPGAIPWLLLDATPAAAPGIFAGVTLIQRLSTEGGQPGEAPCGEAQRGQELRAPYRAVYRFFAS